MTRKISRLGLLLAMGAALGGGVPLPEPSHYRAPETRGRVAPMPPPPVERAKTQRELDAEAKRARRRERNLRNADKAPTGDYFIGVDFARAEAPAVVVVEAVATLPDPVKITPNAKKLLEHLQGGHHCLVSKIVETFPTPQSAKATIASALKAGLVEVQVGWIQATPLGLVSYANSPAK